MLIKCNYCHKEFERNKAYIQKHHPVYCSRMCNTNAHNIDGYCPALNLSIEVDEPKHFKDGIKATQLHDKDMRRQTYLEEVLRCSFIRIPVGYSR